MIKGNGMFSIEADNEASVCIPADLRLVTPDTLALLGSVIKHLAE